ncbi:hypothetical protein [Streptomyces sp. DH12]|uniref:hypothetical protein n=1 Tax=Streptomyces sp. DH12 TaxID=2857010 RepID=UPI001E59C3CC|nr:hypothetical protein [Streptomyces sp. DH12]
MRYRAVTTYMTSTIDYRAPRAATPGAAKDLYGDAAPSTRPCGPPGPPSTCGDRPPGPPPGAAPGGRPGRVAAGAVGMVPAGRVMIPGRASGGPDAQDGRAAERPGRRNTHDRREPRP